MSGRLKDIIETQVLDHGDYARVESRDMRCLCETIAICFQELIDKLDEVKKAIDETREPSSVEIWGDGK